jgi:hypothetical protein
MKIGLIDVDGHNFPNLALMRISAWHKSQGDEVEWWNGNFFYYDIVYKSKIFSDAYSIDDTDPYNCGEVIKGGTGYAISLVEGKEVYDKSKDPPLPPHVERMFPDYSIYPQFDYAVSMTSRGCPNNCAFCHVTPKEGRCSVKVADVKDFWCGQKKIVVLDPNITACREKRDLLSQYRDTKAVIDFCQGLDIRLLNDEDIDDINAMRIKELHFAWDNPKLDLENKFREYTKKARHKPHGTFGTVYCLTNYNSTMEENLYRIYTLRDLGYDPYVMVYDKPHAPQEIKRLQRWCNNRFIFKSCKRFEDYNG